MNPLSRLTLTARLYTMAALLSLCLTVVAVLTCTALAEISQLAQRAKDTRVPQLQRAGAIELNVTRVSLQLRHAMLARHAEELAATLADIATRRQLITQAMAEYEHHLQTAAARERFAPLVPAMEEFWRNGEANLRLIKQGQRAEAMAFLVEHTIPARNAVLALVAQAVQHQGKGLADEIATLDADATRARNMQLALVSAVGVGLALFAWHLGAIIRRRVGQAGEVAARVAEGDLSTPVHDAARDEFSPLLAALSQMQASLRHTVAAVRENAQSVATASAQIANGNIDLSQRTEEQAAALQQTAATMGQLGATVTHNADNAHQAEQLAAGASAVARRGGQAVGEVVATMKGINESSHRIAGIIGVIDGIAFQTNILSLNAAVEAARAGDHGRGFAVVAGEVRTLAQRCAEAAREIKRLISASVERAEHGSALADQAGATMNDVVEAIGRLTALVGEISLASAEQARGVSQVGQAVAQIDQATQQNSALVEQSAAAAESLETQARALVHAVSVFRLTGNALPAGTAGAEAAAAVAPAAAARSTAGTEAPAALAGADWRHPGAATAVVDDRQQHRVVAAPPQLAATA